MKQTINKDQFRHAFNQIRPDNFSYEGQGELFDFLEECEACDACEMELDVIAICCDFSQCSLKEFKESYSIVEEIQLDKGLSLKDAIQYYMEEQAFWFAFVEDGKEVVFQNI